MPGGTRKRDGLETGMMGGYGRENNVDTCFLLLLAWLAGRSKVLYASARPWTYRSLGAHGAQTEARLSCHLIDVCLAGRDEDGDGDEDGGLP